MTQWEVDWTHPSNTGEKVMARNLTSPRNRSREWHMMATGYLREQGIATPTYRADSWEVDWNKRNGKLVWGRNPHSKFVAAREWHWIDFHTISRNGLAWRPKTEKTGRYLNRQGYVLLTRRAMTDADIQIAKRCNLFRGSKEISVMEHRLVAAKKYGHLPKGAVVRHLNGVKTDNSPENLVIGTTQENTMDHNTARLMAMYWRNKYEELLSQSGV